MNDKPRLEIIDMLRGVAALAVTWFHMTRVYKGNWPEALVSHTNWVEKSGSFGWLGVEVFFVISGFVIPYSIANTYGTLRPRSFLSYLAQRIVRIEPPYLASIILVLALWQLSAVMPMFRGQPPQTNLHQLAAHFLYLIPLTEYDWLQPVYWTLAYEFVFYIVIGMLFPFVGGPLQTRNWIIAMLGVTAASLLGILPIRGLLFVMGIAIYRRMSCRDGWGTTATVVVLAAAMMAFKGAALEGLVGAATAAVIALSVTIPLHSFALRALASLGTISYSLYLIHVPIGGRVVNLGSRFIEGPIQHFALSVLATAVSLVAALVFWRFIEKPAIHASRRIARTSGRLRHLAA